jgi:hypothetical protein
MKTQKGVYLASQGETKREIIRKHLIKLREKT